MVLAFAVCFGYVCFYALSCCLLGLLVVASCLLGLLVCCCLGLVLGLRFIWCCVICYLLLYVVVLFCLCFVSLIVGWRDRL